MSVTFQQENIVNNNDGVWGSPELIQNRIGLGIITGQLYDDGGTLKLKICKIGFTDLTNTGIIDNDAIKSLDISGVSNGNWFAVEAYGTGTSGTIEVNELSGETDPDTIPASFTGAWLGARGGYYIDQGSGVYTKRCIGLGWKNLGGTLEGVVNVLSALEGYIGESESSTFRVVQEDLIWDFLTNFAGVYAPGHAYINQVVAKSADYTITDTDRVGTVAMTTGGQKRTVTLPTLADNQSRIITIRKVDSGSGFITVDGEGAETIEGLTTINLYSQYDYLTIQGTAATWSIIGMHSEIWTGWVNTSDWTNRHLGNINLVYDNLTGSYLDGEIIREYSDAPRTIATGNYGTVISDNGTTAILYNIGGGGAFTNNLYLKGDTSGATSDVDGATKNVDTNVTHLFVKNVRNLEVNIFGSSDGTEGNSQEVKTNHGDSGAAVYGATIFNIDTDEWKFQTGSGGLITVADAGTNFLWDTDDYYYNIITRLRK